MEINLKIENEEAKKAYFKMLSEQVKIPVCLNCEKLFSLGFPNTETGLADYTICEENELLCRCEHFVKIAKLHNSDSEGLISLSGLYKTK